MEDIKVLLVDDEEEFVTTLAERLELRGIKANTATTGEDALQLVETYRPDVVVLDVLMPGMSGLEVLRKIRGIHPEILIILITGEGYTESEMEGIQLGAYDCMIKPINIEELIKKMDEALKKY